MAKPQKSQKNFGFFLQCNGESDSKYVQVLKTVLPFIESHYIKKKKRRAVP